MALRSKIRFVDEDEELRPDKPRFYGVTEIMAPSFAFQDLHKLEDMFEAFGQFVDGLKLSGDLDLMPKNLVKEITDIAHRHDITVGTGDWFENLHSNNFNSFSEFLEECKELGFDVIDLNTKMLKLPEQRLLQLIRMIKNAKLKVKPQLGIQFDRSTIPNEGNRAFGAYVPPSPSQSGYIEDVDLLIRKAERFLEAGADMIMIDADGLNDHAKSLRTDMIAKIISRLGLQKTMFEATRPELFEWFVKGYGARVNLFVDPSHVNKLECMRNGALGFNIAALNQRPRGFNTTGLIQRPWGPTIIF